MNRTLYYVAIGIAGLVLGLAGCGNDDESGEPGGTSTPSIATTTGEDTVTGMTDEGTTTGGATTGEDDGGDDDGGNSGSGGGGDDDG